MSQRVTWTQQQFQDYVRRATKAQAQVDAIIAAHNAKPKPVKPKSTKVKTQAETEYELILKAEHPHAAILFQAYTLKLAFDTRYTPDYAVVEDERVSFYEIKGRYVFEKALNKPKIAAAMFPQHKFFLAQKSEVGWKVRYLRPS